DAPSRDRSASVDFPTGPGQSRAGVRPGRQQAVRALAGAQRFRARGLPEKLSCVPWSTPRLLHLRFAALGFAGRPPTGWSGRGATMIEHGRKDSGFIDAGAPTNA